MSRLWKKKSSRGSLLLISSLFVASGAIRLGVDAGQAVATESPFLQTQDNQAKPQIQPANSDQMEISVLLTAFQEREQRIAEAEERLAIRQKALQVANNEIERRLVSLKTAEDSLKSLLALANTAAEDDLVRLTAVYENMKPKEAAGLFEEMDPAFAAGFLGRMRPDAAAGVMAGLSPQAAYSVSVILAGRNADVPKN